LQLQVTWIFIRSGSCWQFRRQAWIRLPANAQGGDGMGSDRALAFIDQMLWNALIVALPILLVILIVGVLISVLQVATQIQEITLSYAPKIIVAALMLILIGPWMSGRVTDFARSLYATIPTLAG
jgi:flagellar biosynthesis protein FliQ